jgi:hypothetical protein
VTSPYRRQPRTAFWSRAVSEKFEPAETITSDEPLLRPGDLVVSAGSCFAATLVPHLQQAGYHYLRTELPPPVFAALPENLGYRDYSAAYGNLYTARQMRQLIERAVGRLRPTEDRWHIGPHVVDPFRPGLRYPARSDAEFEALTAQHLAAVRDAFGRATVILLTLGMTEAWASALDGAVFPACPGTVAGAFDPDRHLFFNFTIDQVRDDLTSLIVTVREFNPRARFVLTVSPVPMIATATTDHVLTASVYSKSVLRVAAGEVARRQRDVTYFPAYEIVTGPQAPEGYFEPDRRHVSERGVTDVMNALFAHCERPASARDGARSAQPSSADGRASTRAPLSAFDAAALSRAVVEAECDEALLDIAS